MGPTTILKGTHTKEYHATIKIDMESYSVDGTIETISNIDDENVEKKTRDNKRKGLLLPACCENVRAFPLRSKTLH